MSPSFNQIPSNQREPFVAVEFDSSKAQQGPSILAYRGLLIGQKLAAGSQAANTLVRVTNADQVIPLAGRGSMLHRQAIAWFASNKSTELWLGVLADDGAGVAATGTITVGNAATGAGTIALYLGGVRITVGVNAADTVDTIATAIAAAINAAADLPVTAAAVAAVVTLTFRHKGLVGNSFDVRHSFRYGEALPAGVTLAIVAMAGGTTAPSLTNLIAAMADMWFHVIAHPYSDATNLTAIEAELASRANAMRAMDGIAITSMSGTFSAHTTLGSARNSAYSYIVSQPGPTPLTPPMEFAAETAALVALYGQQDPARPMQTLAMANAIAPAETDLWSPEERNLFLFDGIATTKVGAGSVVQLSRIISTYQTNAAGADDTAYLDVTTVLTLMYLRYDFRARIQTKYPRHKLAADNTRAGAGQALITPKLGKAEAIAWFREKEEQGLVEGFDQFKRDLVCVRGADPNRLEWVLPTDLINFLAVSAASIQFRL